MQSCSNVLRIRTSTHKLGAEIVQPLTIHDCHYLFGCSSCPRFGLWEPLRLGSWVLSPCPHSFLSIFFLSSTTECSGHISYFLCPGPGIMRFSKEPSFLLLVKGSDRPRVILLHFEVWESLVACRRAQTRIRTQLCPFLDEWDSISYLISIGLFLSLLNGDHATDLLGWSSGLSDTLQKVCSTAPGGSLKSSGELSVVGEPLLEAQAQITSFHLENGQDL